MRSWSPRGCAMEGVTPSAWRRASAGIAMTSRGIPIRYYRRALVNAEERIRRTAARSVDIAALSVFTTQTATHIVERMRAAIEAAPAPTLNFNVGSRGRTRGVRRRADRGPHEQRRHQPRRPAHAASRQPQPVARDRPGRRRHGRVRHVPYARLHDAPIGPRRTDPDAHRYACRDRRDGRRVRPLATGWRAPARRLAGPDLRSRFLRRQEHRRAHRRDRRAARPRDDHDQRDRPRPRPAHNDDTAAHRRHDDDVRCARRRLRPERRRPNQRVGAAARPTAARSAQRLGHVPPGDRAVLCAGARAPGGCRRRRGRRRRL